MRRVFMVQQLIYHDIYIALKYSFASFVITWFKYRDVYGLYNITSKTYDIKGDSVMFMVLTMIIHCNMSKKYNIKRDSMQKPLLLVTPVAIKVNCTRAHGLRAIQDILLTNISMLSTQLKATFR